MTRSSVTIFLSTALHSVRSLHVNMCMRMGIKVWVVFECAYAPLCLWLYLCAFLCLFAFCCLGICECTLVCVCVSVCVHMYVRTPQHILLS